MAGAGELEALLAGLAPRRNPGRYVFVGVPGPLPAELDPVVVVREQEGLTLVVAQEDADRLGLVYELVTAWITLGVESPLAAVGLTAAVTRVLAEHGIAANVVAALHHDHLFVPVGRADEALAALGRLSGR